MSSRLLVVSGVSICFSRETKMNPAGKAGPTRPARERLRRGASYERSRRDHTRARRPPQGLRAVADTHRNETRHVQIPYERLPDRNLIDERLLPARHPPQETVTPNGKSY